jgi:deazaflavin-dependent oxidoreductase (nitroreductase family)
MAALSLDTIFSRLNPLFVWLLRSPLQGLASGGLMLLTFTGRRTGRRFTIPVGYQRDGDVLTVMVSYAARKQWWKNYREAGAVELLLRGRPRTGTAQVVPSDSQEFRHQAERTLRRLPWMAGQFGIEHRKGEKLDDEQWAQLAKNIACVQVTLDSEAT